MEVVVDIAIRRRITAMWDYGDARRGISTSRKRGTDHVLYIVEHPPKLESESTKPFGCLYSGVRTICKALGRWPRNQARPPLDSPRDGHRSTPHVLHVDRLYALIVWLFPPRLSLCECSAACIRYLFLVLSLFQHQIDRIRSDLPPSNLTDLPLAAAVQP